MDISIIIPNYNGEYLLKNNLPKVVLAAKSYKKGTVEIIITDDASYDGSLAFLESFTKKNSEIHFKIVTSKKNRGFSGNVTNGARKATGEILILLNTDVAPYKDFLMPLLPHFQDETVFAVACLEESLEDGKKILRGRGIGKWTRGFLIHGKGEVNKTTTLWASGGSSAFRKSIWDKIGGLNELYNPFYWEDIDLSYRAQKAGYKIVFEQKSKVIHEHSKGSIKTQHTEEKITKVAYRNQFFFVWLNITDSSFILSHLLWLPIHIGSAIVHGNTTLLAGFFEALLSLPQVLLARRKNYSLLKCSDKDVINSVQ